MDKKELQDLSLKLEAILFSYAESLSYKKCEKILGISFSDLKEVIEILKSRYKKNSALELIEINLSLQIVAKSKYSEYIDKLFDVDKGRGLSRAQLETLSIAAYRQPITKREVEQIRGVNSAKVVQTLVDLDLIEPVGKKEAPGLPVIYATTENFLMNFGLKNISELPDLEDKDFMSLFDDK